MDKKQAKKIVIGDKTNMRNTMRQFQNDLNLVDKKIGQIFKTGSELGTLTFDLQSNKSFKSINSCKSQSYFKFSDKVDIRARKPDFLATQRGRTGSSFQFQGKARPPL